MPPHKPCLIGMPKEVMRHIVGYLDLLAVSLSLLFHYPNDNKKRDVHKVFDCFKELTTNYKELSLKVTSLHLTCKGEHEVLEVLPFCDPEYVRVLNIDVGTKHGRLELQEIIYLKQWTNAKEVELIGCFAHYSHFEHFEKVGVAIQTITTEDIMEMKEIFLQQPHMSHVCIKFQHYYTENDLTQRFGDPSIGTDEWGNNPYNIWYLKISDGREVMKMQYSKGAGTMEHRDVVSMDRFLVGDVPGFANMVDVD